MNFSSFLLQKSSLTNLAKKVRLVSNDNEVCVYEGNF